MPYYSGSNTEIINELANDIDQSLDVINEKINVLEGIDWDEIFEHVPNSDAIKVEIIMAISDISSALYQLK
jgi:hypothetical protein